MLKWIEQELAALEGVTPGPWTAEYRGDEGGMSRWKLSAPSGAAAVFYEGEADMRHIARWSPDRVEKLLRLLDETHEVIQTIRNELGVPDSTYAAPVANASYVAWKALDSIEAFGQDDGGEE